jgi:hypothetical protein
VHYVVIKYNAFLWLKPNLSTWDGGGVNFAHVVSDGMAAAARCTQCTEHFMASSAGLDARSHALCVVFVANLAGCAVTLLLLLPCSLGISLG